MGFREKFGKGVPESAHEDVLAALRSGLSPAAAATVAGVSATTGYVWARAAGWKAGGGHTGIRYSAAVREAFWAAMRSGSSTAQAAKIAGVSEMSAIIWVKQAGYVPRTQRPAVFEIVSCRRPRAPLTFVERCRLEELLEGGCTAVRAAELLDRHRDTIGREIVRGLTGSGYRARVGQDKADAERKRPKERRLEFGLPCWPRLCNGWRRGTVPSRSRNGCGRTSPTIRRCGCHTRRSIRPSTSSRVGSWPGWSRPRCALVALSENRRAARKTVKANSKT